MTEGASEIPTIDADVLVVGGGGGAGACAALSAAESGARVMLALKGVFGTSGATADARAAAADGARLHPHAQPG